MTKKILFSILLTILIVVTAYTSDVVYTNSQERAKLKEDISKVNDVMFGLMSVNHWESEIRKITVKQIEEFKLTKEQDSLIRVAIDEVLVGVIKRTDKVIQDDDGTVLKFIRKHAVNLFFDVEDFQKNVPDLTDAIMKKITSEDGKERLKLLVLSKIDELAVSTYDSTKVERYNKYLNKYGVDSKEEFNRVTTTKVDAYYKAVLYNSFVPIGIAIVFVLLWIIFRNNEELKYILLSFSILFGAVILLTGVASPMIEIDARFREMNFFILGENIEFSNQYIFYRSKSIFEIVSLMMSTGKIDSMVVAFMIFSFSVLLPFMKLTSMSIYLYSAKYRTNKLAKWMTFKSGKWSMADVMVVAIFMAYVAFQGILDNQLEGLNQNSDTLTAITTNHTALQPGFYVFVTYVVFSILLSSYLGKSMDRETNGLKDFK
ncbi:MAG: paraquat-inducible protein A [Candidatus Kapaibacterium sp.]